MPKSIDQRAPAHLILPSDDENTRTHSLHDVSLRSSDFGKKLQGREPRDTRICVQFPPATVSLTMLGGLKEKQGCLALGSKPATDKHGLLNGTL